MRLKLLFAVLLPSALTFAQVDRANVTGTLRDASGAIVIAGRVAVSYPATGQRREVPSNGSGQFLLSGLPIGHVVIDATKTGFRPVRVETDLNVGETRTLDLLLDVAGVETSVQVVGEADLVQNTAAIGVAFENTQISKLPVNGRNFGNLMALVPGAVDSGGSNIRFLGHGGDDNNLRIDGVDATSVRNQTQKSRLLVSTDAIAEFRVNTAMYTAESGGAPAGQIEVVTKSGANQLHGGLFEYLRNSAFDSRSPFDKTTKVPALRLNQFGGSLGGKIRKDQTFFFVSYEGLAQRQAKTQIGFVPSAAFKEKAVTAIQPILALYPKGMSPFNANVDNWSGLGSSQQDEHVGLIRLDHRISDKLSSYFRFSKNNTESFSPSAVLPVGTSNHDAPTSGLFDVMYLVSPRTTNELRLGGNYAEPLNSDSLSTNNGINIAVAVPSLSTIPAGTKRIAIGITQSLIDQWSTLRGAHTIKAGVEVRRLQLIIHDYANAQAGSLNFLNIADFQNGKLNTVEYSGELPTKQMRKIGYFGYVQDEWKIKPNLTANLGLRYEYYGVFGEIHRRAIPFDIQTCGGYCPAGSDFAFPDTNNFAPRISFAWTPKALKDRTVIRFGGGIFYGDAQLGDAYSPANNDALRFSLSAATTPGLSYPIDRYINPGAASATAPRSMPRNKRNQVSQQWGFTIQHAINTRANFQVGYNGQQNYHVFNRNLVNVLDPVTKKAPLPLDIVDVRGEDGVGSFHGMISSISVSGWKGMLFRANYMLSHAINDGSSGGGGADGPPQNVACRACEKGNSSIDARHVFSSNFAYQIPFARNRWYGGWDWSGIATARTGLPLNVSVTRAAAAMPDGNVTSTQRPNLVPGVPLYSDYASTGLWLNPAAFVAPAAGTWGNLGRNVLRAPGLFQLDTALTKETRITELTHLQMGVQVFNIMNHPQLGAPGVNISSVTGFGRITAPVNTSPVGSGTPRQMQFLMRLTF